MKVTILQNKLKEGLKIVERISQKSLTLPILSNVFIEAKENFLNLKTTDLETGISWWALAKIEREGKITLPVNIFSSFVSLLPNKPVILNLTKKILEIECGNHKSQIKGQDPEEFPIIPTVKEGKSFSLPSNLFSQALSKVFDIATPSLARPAISGIFFCFEKESLKVVATDSFRLGEKKLFLKDSLEGNSFILPQKAVRELINIFGEREGEVKAVFSPNQILLQSLMSETPHPQIHFTSKLIEGEYPDYEEIIPKGFKTQIILKKEEFLNQIKIASLFAGKINEVRFKIDPKEKVMEVLSQNPELGAHRSSISGEMKGERVEVSFNYKFLSEGVSKIEGPKVVFELNGDSGPSVLKPLEKDLTFLYIVMPIKPS